MNYKKILVFSPYYPPHAGGLESHSREFNARLAENGAGITVFTPHLPRTAPETEKGNGVTIIRFPAFEIISNYPLPKFWNIRFWTLFFGLFRQDFDIVISRTRFFFTSILALIYAKLRKRKWIHIEHGSDFVRLSSKLKTHVAKLYDYTLGALIFRCSDLNVSISKAVQKFVYRFDKRESPIIYRGLDFNSIDIIPADATIRNEYPDKIIITTAARLYKWKGIEHTIAAIRILPDEIKAKVVFLIVGDGEDFGRLQELSEGLPIHMTGALDRDSVISLLKSTDIYIHSSLPGGGLSTSLLEAMYCECAIIASPNEGADEVVSSHRNGILIETSNHIAIEKQIEILVNNEVARTTLSKQAKMDIIKTFTWDTSIRLYEHVFGAQ